ncbi:MAG: type 4a pilus biogenesis protein PilO [Zoogloeaceae bacterium]|jgi:type IV pilus assembly protein PilO|nr:type 4a pilus biogenesis protein PilO [Zoogloeaceae bacterium]
MSISEDFRCLSNKDPGTWLPIPRLTVLVLILVGVVVLLGAILLAPQWSELDAAQREEEQLKEEFITSKQASISLDLYRRQLEEIDRSFGALLKQLPDKTEVESLLAEVNQSGLGQGLQFDLFKPEASVSKDFYAELPIDVKVNGNYHEFGAFAADIAKLPRIVTLNDIRVSPGQGGKLVMEMKLKTFRYLEATETAAAQ